MDIEELKVISTEVMPAVEIQQSDLMPTFKNVVNLPAAEEVQQKPKVLIANVFSEMLRFAGHPAPEAWMNTEAGSINPDHQYCDQPLQRFLVNRQLRVVLGAAQASLGVCTINLRSMLLDEQDVLLSEWKAPVKNSIVPFFIKHGLPLPEDK